MYKMHKADDSLKSRQYLRAKIKIGNCKGPVSYNLDQTVFHHDDIPEDRRVRHTEIKHWLKSNLLSDDRPGWHKSTDAGVPVCERRKMENFANDRSNAYQYNFRGESLDCLKTVEPIDKPTKLHISTQLESTALAIRDARAQSRVQTGNLNRTGEMPVHPRLDSAGKWQLSTFVSTRETDKQLADMTNDSLNWTKKVNTSAQMEKKYVGPMQAAALLQKEIRKQKMEGTFSTDKQVNRPRTEPVDRRKLRNRFALEKLNKQSSHQHSGVWEANKTDGKLVNFSFFQLIVTQHCIRFMWSDTGSGDYFSKGDVVRTVNLDAYNFEGPNFIHKKLNPLPATHHHIKHHE